LVIIGRTAKPPSRIAPVSSLTATSTRRVTLRHSLAPGDR
jgi:hypothetical protein